MKGIPRNTDLEPSRREFLTTAVSAGGAMLFASVCLNASSQEADPRIAQIMSKTIGIDMHNHVYPKGTEPHPQGGRGPGGGPQGGPGRGGGPPAGAPQWQDQRQQGPDLFLAEELKQSGLTAVCASFVL